MHTRIVRIVVLALFILVPQTAAADVIINEIAWMGTLVSSNDEWIELHNDGSSAISLEGWRLEDGNNLTIALAGTIPARGYYLLERTDDASVPNKPADLIYTGALANTGVTLSLYNASGARVDRIDGGENWEIGGDNVSKYTTSLIDGEWGTSQPTPKAANREHEEPPEDPGEEPGEAGELICRVAGQEPQVRTTTSSTTTTTKPTKQKVIAEGKPRTNTKAAPLAFASSGDVEATIFDSLTLSAEPVGMTQSQVANVHFAWNFGDGGTAQGSSVSHKYQFPGDYIVEVVARYFDEEAKDSFAVSVDPLMISIAEASDSFIRLQNGSDRPTSLSNWSVRNGGSIFLIPEGTTIAAGGALTLPASATGFAQVKDDLALLRFDGAVEASLEEEDPIGIDAFDFFELATSTESSANIPATTSPFAIEQLASVGNAIEENVYRIPLKMILMAAAALILGIGALGISFFLRPLP